MRSTPKFISLADFHLLSIAKSNIFEKKTDIYKRNYEIHASFFLQFSGWQVEEVSSIFVDTLLDSASFRGLTSLIELTYLNLPSNFVIDIFTFIGNV